TVGLLVARVVLRILESGAALGPPRPAGMEYRLDARVAMVAVSLAIAVAIALSIVPAGVLARLDVQQLLRAGSSGSGGARWTHRAQRWFVVAQVASAVALLAGAGLMAETVLQLSRVDLAFDYAHLLQAAPSYPHSLRIREKYMPLTDRVLLALRSAPGATDVAMQAVIP